MTTVAEAKAALLSKIGAAASGVMNTRGDIVKGMQLGMALLADPKSAGLTTGSSTSNNYDAHCQFYGKQRAILRGLTAGDCLFHSIASPTVWQSLASFTMPSTTVFGYAIFDDSGNPVTISNAALYYLTKNLSTGNLASLVNDAAGYALPQKSVGVQQNIGTGPVDGTNTPWQSTHTYTQDQVVVPTVANGLFFRVIINGTSGGSEPTWPTNKGDQVSDGSTVWVCAGQVLAVWSAARSIIAGAATYATTSANGFVFQAANDGVTGGSEPVWPTSIGASVVDGTVTWMCIASTTYAKTLPNPAIANSVKIYVGGVLVGADDGAGNITGTGIVTGSINYGTGAVSVKLYPPPFGSQQIVVVYDAVLGFAQWQTKYAQVGFTLSSSTYGPGGVYTLHKINLAGGAIGAPPAVLSIYAVRAYKDHSKLGNLVVVTEGLEGNPSWNKISDPATSCMMVTDADFQTLLGGYINQGSPDDVLKSSDPNNISTGLKVGVSYPNIEANPFFPATDGTYSGDAPFNSDYVHVESAAWVWEVDTGYKFLYGTRPVHGITNPPPQNNPGTVTSGVAAIGSIGASPTGNNPVPADTTSGSGGTRYTFNQKDNGTGTYSVPVLVSTGDNLVYATVYDSGTGNFVSTAVLSPCVWNTLQTFLAQANGGAFLNTQMAAINSLGNFQNVIDPSRWGSGSGVDPTFFTNAATFKTALQAWITYHTTTLGNPKPGTGVGPSYVLTTWNALVTAASTFATQLSARITDLDTVLGTNFTAGYTGKIYSACNLATNKSVGHVRAVKDKQNSMAGLYATITKYQAAYAVYP